MSAPARSAIETEASAWACAHGIHVIDTGFHRPRFDASYLIVEDGRGAFVDTGTNASVPRLLAAMEAAGVTAEALDYVIATHVHLDHAGGVGLLMQQLPSAKLVVHPRGARHLIDPARLMDGARAVYGAEEVARAYGDVQPVPAERVVTTHDGMRLSLAGRPLTFHDTPGHARHHHTIFDPRGGGLFTGDTFGISYREFDNEQGAWIMPSSTPVQFEPDAMRHSIERLLALSPRYLCLTHYGPVPEPTRMATLLFEQLDAMVALARSVEPGPGRHPALVDGLDAIHWASLRAHGCRLGRNEVTELLALDLELNAQGIAIWLDRSRARRS